MFGTLHPRPGRSVRGWARLIGIAALATVLGRGTVRATTFTVDDAGDTVAPVAGETLHRRAGAGAPARAAARTESASIRDHTG